MRIENPLTFAIGSSVTLTSKTFGENDPCFVGVDGDDHESHRLTRHHLVKGGPHRPFEAVKIDHRPYHASDHAEIKIRIRPRAPRRGTNGRAKVFDLLGPVVHVAVEDRSFFDQIPKNLVIFKLQALIFSSQPGALVGETKIVINAASAVST